MSGHVEAPQSTCHGWRRNASSSRRARGLRRTKDPPSHVEKGDRGARATGTPWRYRAAAPRSWCPSTAPRGWRHTDNVARRAGAEGNARRLPARRQWRGDERPELWTSGREGPTTQASGWRSPATSPKAPTRRNDLSTPHFSPLFRASPEIKRVCAAPKRLVTRCPRFIHRLKQKSWIKGLRACGGATYTNGVDRSGAKWGPVHVSR